MDSSDNNVYLIEKPIEYETYTTYYTDSNGENKKMTAMSEPLHNRKGETLYFQWGVPKGYTAKELSDGAHSLLEEDYKFYPYNNTDIVYGPSEYLPSNAEYDPVYANTNGKFRMPTKPELEALVDNGKVKYGSAKMSLYFNEGIVSIPQPYNYEYADTPNSSFYLPSNKKAGNASTIYCVYTYPRKATVITEAPRYLFYPGWGVSTEND